MYMSVNYTIIGSDNGLLPVRRQPYIRINDGLLTIFEVQKFSFKEMHTKMQKWRPPRLGLNVIMPIIVEWRLWDMLSWEVWSGRKYKDYVYGKC